VKRIYSLLMFLLCTFLISMTCLTPLPIVGAQSNKNISSIGISSYGTISYSPTPTPTPTPTSTPTPTPSPTPTPTPTTGLSPLHVDGTHLKDANGNIVILRGVVYSTSQWWGDYDSQCTEQQFIYLHNMGCDCVSLSIQDYTFDQYHGANCYNNPNFWTKLDNIIAWTYAHGLYVNLRFWATSGADANGNPSNHLNTYMSGGTNEYTWSYWLSIANTISSRYKNYNNIIYEPLSEGLYCSYSDYQTHMQNVIDTIRANAPNAIINVQAESSGDWPCTFAFEQSNPINRSNIIFSCDPYGFFTYPNNSPSAIASSLSTIGTYWLESNGYCVFFSEFGPQDTNPYSSWDTTWLNNFMALCDSNGYSGYTAFRWCTSASDSAYYLLADWNGDLSTYGTTVSTYYLAHT